MLRVKDNKIVRIPIRIPLTTRYKLFKPTPTVSYGKLDGKDFKLVIKETSLPLGVEASAIPNTNITTIVWDESFYMEWVDSSGVATSYQIELRDSVPSVVAEVEGIEKTNIIFDNDVEPGLLTNGSTYEITLIKLIEPTEYPSTPISFTPANKVPQNLVKATESTISWDAVAGDVLNYFVYIRQGGVLLRKDYVEGTSYDLSFLEINTDYTVTVTANSLKSIFESGESNFVTVRLTDSTHLSFNGVDQYVNAGTLGTFGSSLMQLNTIECKFVNSDSATQILIGAYQSSIANNNTFGQRLRYSLNADTAGNNSVGTLLIEVIVDNRSSGDPESILAQVSGLPLNDGISHHLAVVTDKAAATVDVIFDGVVQTVTYSSQGNSTQFVDWHIDVTLGVFNQLRDGTTGIGTLSDFLSGRLDEFRIWSDKRTFTEIQNNKDIELDAPNGYATDFPNLFRYYKCNEGTGDVLREEVVGDNGVLVGNVDDNMWGGGNL